MNNRTFIKRVRLLDELKSTSSEGIVSLPGLASEFFMDIDAAGLSSLFCLPLEFRDNGVIELSFDGAIAATPRAAGCIVRCALALFQERNVPVVFTDVASHIWDVLNLCCCSLKPPIAFWVVNEEENLIVGGLSKRNEEILSIIAANGMTSANELSSFLYDERTKVSVGTASIYLQKLFLFGLLLREKVTASETNRIERGWTYLYQIVPDALIFSEGGENY
ncbi:MAG: hypothetical protein F6J93_27660 [Oscillatoria sp. SIO1A7]|nr:hypothetical protein [Oscillatoria sp. SIO1A7]